MPETESLILEMLRAIRTEIAGLRSDLKENTARLGRVEASLVGLRRDFAHSEEGQVEQDSRIDRLAARVERIEKRLELTDQP